MNEEIKQEPENKVLDFPVEKKVELEDKTYRLEEMHEAMNASLANIDEVMSQQNELVNIVLSSDKAKDFRDFVKDVENQLDNMKSQKAALSIRAGLLKNVVDECKSDEKIAQIVTMLVEALGVFQN